MRRFPSSWSDSLLASLGFRRQKNRRKAERRNRRSRVEPLERREMLSVSPGVGQQEELTSFTVAAASFAAGDFVATSVDWSQRESGGQLRHNSTALAIDSGGGDEDAQRFNPGEAWTFEFNTSGVLMGLSFADFTVGDADRAELIVGDNDPLTIRGVDVEGDYWRSPQPLAFAAGDRITLRAVAATEVDLRAAWRDRLDRQLAEDAGLEQALVENTAESGLLGVMPVAGRVSSSFSQSELENLTDSAWQVNGLFVLGHDTDTLGGYIDLARQVRTVTVGGGTAPALATEEGFTGPIAGGQSSDGGGMAMMGGGLPDLVIRDFRVGANFDEFTVEYEVQDEDAGSFRIDVFRSPNGSTLDGNPLISALVDDPNKLGVTQPGHTHTVTISTSQFTTDVQEDYYLVAVLNREGTDDTINEIDRSDNQMPFAGGVFVDGSNVVHFQASTVYGSDNIRVDHNEGKYQLLVYNGVSYDVAYDHDDPFELHARTHGGNDTIRVNDSSLTNVVWGFGGDGNDNLYGGAGNDYFEGAGYGDYIYGRAGDDIAYGGDEYGDAGNGYGGDFIFGEDGEDRLYGGQGSDWIDGGNDDDTIEGGWEDATLVAPGGYNSPWSQGGQGGGGYFEARGGDYIKGGLGDDTIDGNEGDDYIAGGGGNDILHGGDDDDYLVGGDPWSSTNTGNDQLSGDAGDDLLEGGDGNDELIGGAGTDRLYGEAGHDILSNLGGGSDTLRGELGDDTYRISNLADGTVTLSDTGGNDTIDLSHDWQGPTGGTLDLSREAIAPRNIVYDPQDVFDGATNVILQLGVDADIENAVGTPFDDLLLGNDLNNTLTGGEGNDILISSTGTNTFDWGNGGLHDPIVVRTLVDEDEAIDVGVFAISDISLREALAVAAAQGGDDEIVFGVTGTVSLTNGELSVDSDVQVSGPGPQLLTIDASTNDADPDANQGDGSRVFNVSDQNSGVVIDVSISGVALTGGDTASDGGAILSYEDLTLHNVSFLSNYADRYGGGLYAAAGVVTVTSSTFFDNEAANSGGGIRIEAADVTSTLIVASTFYKNRSNYGAGLHLYGQLGSTEGPVDVINSTFSDNTATGHGGGIRSYRVDPVNIINSTIFDNTASEGGGIAVVNSSPVVQNSIVSLNTAGTGSNANFTIPSSINYVVGDPLLAPLGDYGGPTQTHLPLPGSPVIDAGDRTFLDPTITTDGRGAHYRRELGANVDIGAVETNVTVSGTDLTVYGTDGADAITIGDTDVRINTVGGYSYSIDPSVTDIVVYGYDGDDTIVGSDRAETIYGGSGNDLITSEAGNDAVYGGAGDDTIFGGADNDNIEGSAGSDAVYGGAGNDMIRGGDGDDRLFGEAGDDSLYGDAGDDWLEDSIGQSMGVLDGGAGRDTSPDVVLDPNHAPVIEGASSPFYNVDFDATTPEITVMAGVPVDLRILGFDPDGDDLEYSFTIATQGGTTIYDANYGGTPIGNPSEYGYVEFDGPIGDIRWWPAQPSTIARVVYDVEVFVREDAGNSNETSETFQVEVTPRNTAVPHLADVVQLITTSTVTSLSGGQPSIPSIGRITTQANHSNLEFRFPGSYISDSETASDDLLVEAYIYTPDTDVDSSSVASEGVNYDDVNDEWVFSYNFPSNSDTDYDQDGIDGDNVYGPGDVVDVRSATTRVAIRVQDSNTQAEMDADIPPKWVERVFYVEVQEDGQLPPIAFDDVYTLGQNSLSPSDPQFWITVQADPVGNTPGASSYLDTYLRYESDGQGGWNEFGSTAPRSSDVYIIPDGVDVQDHRMSHNFIVDLVLVSGPLHGSLTIHDEHHDGSLENPSNAGTNREDDEQLFDFGSFTYVADDTFNGYDEFWYQIVHRYRVDPYEDHYDSVSNPARVIIRGPLNLDVTQSEGATTTPADCGCSCTCTNDPIGGTNEETGEQTYRVPLGFGMGHYLPYQPSVVVQADFEIPADDPNPNIAANRPANLVIEPLTPAFHSNPSFVWQSLTGLDDAVFGRDESGTVFSAHNSTDLEGPSGTYYFHVRSDFGPGHNATPYDAQSGYLVDLETFDGSDGISRPDAVPLTVIRMDDFGFGPGWNLGGVERIFYEPFKYDRMGGIDLNEGPRSNVSWMRADGSMSQFREPELGYGENQSFNFANDDPSRARIEFDYDERQFIVYHTDGSRTHFQPHGDHNLGAHGAYEYRWYDVGTASIVAHVDAYGNRVDYTYRNGDMVQLNRIEYSTPSLTGGDDVVLRTVTFNYTDDRVLTVDETVGSTTRTTAFVYDESAVSGVTVNYEPLYQIRLPNPDTGVADANSPTMQFGYDVFGRITEVIDADQYAANPTAPDGTSFQYRIDGNGFTITHPMVDGSAASEQFVRSRTTDQSQTFSNLYEPTSGGLLYNAPVALNHASGGSVYRTNGPTFDEALTQVGGVYREGLWIDELDRVTTFTTDSRGYLASVTDPGGHTTSWTRDGHGRVQTVTLPDTGGGSITTTYTYGSGNLGEPLSQITYADSSFVTFAYSANRLTEYRDELNRRVTVEYEDYGDPHAISRMTTRVIVGTLDDPQGTVFDDIVTDTYFDARGLVTHRVETRHDHNNNPLADFETHFAYTDPAAAGILAVRSAWTQVGTDVLNYYVVDTFDSMGNATQIRELANIIGGAADLDTSGDYTQVDDDVRITNFVYDALNRLRTITLPDAGDGNARLQTLLDYTPTGRIEQETQTYVGMGASNMAMRYQYDARHRLTNVWQNYVNGSSTAVDEDIEYQYEWDDAGQLAATIDPLGRRSEYLYDVRGQLIRATAPDPTTGLPGADSPVAYFAYDAIGRTVGDIDPRGAITRYGYDNRHRLTQVIDALGSATFFAYNAASELTRVTDARNRSTTYQYDGAGRLEQLILPGQAATPITWQYDTSSNVREVTDQLGRDTVYEYDDQHRLTRSTFNYTGNGQATANSDENLWTDYTYLSNGQVDTITQLLSSDGLTDVLAMTDYNYDGLGRLDEVIAPHPNGSGSVGSLTTRYQYDQYGRLQYVIDPHTSVTEYQYDALGRTTAVVEENPDITVGTRYNDVTGDVTAYGSLANPADHPTTTFRYDAASRLLDVTDPENRRSSYQYDELDRVERAYMPDVTTLGRGVHDAGFDDVNTPYTEYTYDAGGLMLTDRDRGGEGNNYAYDLLGRLTSQSTVDGTGSVTSTTSYGYDRVHNLTSLLDPVGNLTTWQYDELDRVRRETNELGQARQFEYDAASRLTRRIDRNGRVVDYAYDQASRLEHEYWYDTLADADQGTGQAVHDIDWTYDHAGRMLTSADSHHNYAYSYDALSRVTQRDLEIIGLADHVIFDRSYDMSGRLWFTTASFSDATTVNDNWQVFNYDNLHRLASVTQYNTFGHAVGEKHVDFDYNRAGQLTDITRFDDYTLVDPLTGDMEGVAGQEVATTTFAYDAAGRLDAMIHWKGADTAQATGDVLAGYDYDWDNQNRLTGIDFVPGNVGYTSLFDYSSEDVTYDYDERGQLTDANHATNPASDEEYAYDENGNRIDGSFDVTADNRITTDGTYNYSYDGEGNIVLRTKISDGSYTTYTWDHRNRLIEVTDFDNQSAELTRIEYGYDGSDDLVRRRRFDNGSSTAAESLVFVYDRGQMAFELEDTGNADLTRDDLAHRYLWGGGQQLLADEAIASLTDAELNTSRWALSDHLGTIRDWVDDDAALLDHAVYDSFGNRTDTPAITTSIAWTGMYRDPHTGLQRHGKRWYNPEISRWMSQDWIFAGTNWHAYVGNQVTTYVDWNGLEGWIPDYLEGQEGWIPDYLQGREGWVPDFMWGSTSPYGEGTRVFFHEGIYGTGKAVVTGEAGRSMGERAVQITINESGDCFDGDEEDWRRFRWMLARELSGANSAAEGWYSVDLATEEELGGWESWRRLSAGTAGVSGTAALGFSIAGSAGVSVGVRPIPGTPGLPAIPLPGWARRLNPDIPNPFRKPAATPTGPEHLAISGRQWYDILSKRYGAENVQWVSGSGRTVYWPGELPATQGRLFRVRVVGRKPGHSFCDELESVSGPRPLDSVGHHNNPLYLNGVDDGAVNGAWVIDGEHVFGHMQIDPYLLPLDYGTEIIVKPR